MKRAKLAAIRHSKGWSQEEAAEHLGVTRNTLSQWERGRSHPYPIHIHQLCKIYGKTAAELDLENVSSENTHTDTQNMIKDALAAPPQENFPQSLRESTTLHLFSQIISQDILRVLVELESQDMNPQRRQLIQQFLEIAGAMLLSPSYKKSTALESPIATEEFLLQCASSIKGCWHLLQGKGFAVAEEMLSTYTPTLMALTSRHSKYQETAASLATQAKILQAVLAMHKLNFVGREMYCLEAVRCSHVSGDSKLQAAALMYLGYTYSFCYAQKPEKSVQVFLDALRALGDDHTLLSSDIYMGLSDAYAQCGEEYLAHHTISLAQDHFPAHPEYDPSFLYADCNLSVLYQWEGKMYLSLSKHYPDRGYQQKAWNAISQSATLQSISQCSTNETIIYQADTTRALGDLESYCSYLEEGTQMALALGSQKRYQEALEVYRQTPEHWWKEQKIQYLSKDVFRQLPGKGANS